MATTAQKNVVKKTEDLVNKYKNQSNSSYNAYKNALNSYKNAVNSTYKPSSQVKKYQNQRDDALKKAQAMGEFSYDNKYEDKVTGLLDKAENMDFNFNYSLTDDPAYQQYRDQYVHQGQLAAQDAAAQMVAQTGGYGSTAATAASQQAYNESLTQLNNIVPDLYNQAYNREWGEFTEERDTLQELASAYQSLDQQGYEQALSTWTNNFNQYLSLAQEYNSAYQYLDSAERQQYESKLDGLYNILTSAQNQYSTDTGAYLDAISSWAGAVSDSANYDLNAAQLNETKRHNKATEAAAAAQLAEQKRQFNKSNGDNEKEIELSTGLLQSIGMNRTDNGRKNAIQRKYENGEISKEQKTALIKYFDL